MSKLINILTLILVIAAILMAYYTYADSRPFKMTRHLPEINEEEILDIVMDYSIESCTGCLFEADRKALVDWFNESRELKTAVGTTSDCRITITLKDDSVIYIWNMYRRDMVTIGYRMGEDYYQTNVYSIELAEYFDAFREDRLTIF